MHGVYSNHASGVLQVTVISLKPFDITLHNQFTISTMKIEIELFSKIHSKIILKENPKTPTQSLKTFESNTNKV